MGKCAALQPKDKKTQQVVDNKGARGEKSKKIVDLHRNEVLRSFRVIT